MISWALAAMLSIHDINAINQRCYDNQADNWLRFPFEQHLPEWVDKYNSSKLGTRVLDIGSGNGILAQWLQEKGFQVLCLDPSPEMVRRCREKGLQTLQTTIQDYQTKETFGSVFAILSLIHVPKGELPAQISKIASLLPSDGLFYLGLIEGSSEGIKEKESKYPRFFSLYQKEEVLSLLKKHFTLIDFSKSTGETSYLLFACKKLP